MAAMLTTVLGRLPLLPAGKTTCCSIQCLDASIVLGVQQQRWKRIRQRKPRWMPIAPSKLFNIIEHKPADPDETKQLKRLYDLYRTEIKSLRHYFIKEHQLALEEADKFSAVSLEEAREHERLLEENEKENQRVAQMREERNKQEAEKMVEDLLQREVEAKAKLVELKEHIEQIVREEKAKSDTYITMEKLDAAIEFAIEHPVSYSYAIDPKGNQLWEGTPHYEVSLQESSPKS
ncbi:probable 28S ribosomal protein S26, mitochondrial isoform X2 [Ixodes scapularis]|uniref:probable 28S ribosomal protein S26, mitochondrial isoform X2 n=1 Tax=Ixodes scapularis TaxID=6945 RepID=UPI001A9F39AC|nr:probable 28S ribosomal protein S26, mitochondrial isoform X2 [Ixodes scapularis]